MTIANFPARNNTDWYGWAGDMDRTLRLLGAGVVFPEDHGAKGDGATNDAASLQAAFNAAAGGTVALKPGATYIATNLTVPANTTITGYGATIKSPGNTGNNVFALSATGVTLRGFTIDGNKGSSVTGSAIRADGATRMTLHELVVKNTGSKSIWLEPNNHDWTMRGCRITGSASTGITVAFSDRGIMDSCIVEDCQDGIQLWGGDSADAAATTFINDVTVTACRVSGTFGGIFTSRARYVTVTGCVVSNVTDVGIDFEGGNNCVAAGNTVRNAVHGGLSTFYGAADMLFTGNVVEQAAGMGAGYKSYGTGFSSRIVVDGNLFRTVDSYACYFDQSTLLDSSFTNNTCNVTGANTMAVRNLMNNGVKISGNRITCANQTAIANEGGAGCLLEDNHMTFRGTDTSGVSSGGGAIFNYYKDSTYTAQRNRICGNVAVGFKTGICDSSWGDSSRSLNLIQDNAVDVIARFNSGSYKGVVLDNRTVADPTVASTVTIVT